MSFLYRLRRLLALLLGRVLAWLLKVPLTERGHQFVQQRPERAVLFLHVRVLEDVCQKINEGLDEVVVVHEKEEDFSVEVAAVETDLHYK